MRQDPFYILSTFYLVAICATSGLAAVLCRNCRDISDFVRKGNCSDLLLEGKIKILEDYAAEGFVYEFFIFVVSLGFFVTFNDQCRSTVKQFWISILVALGLSFLATIRMIQNCVSNKSDFTPVLIHFSGEDLIRDTNCDEIPNQLHTRFNFLMMVLVLQPIQLILIVTAFVHFLVFYLEHRNQTERLPTLNAAPISLEDNASQNQRRFSPRFNFWPFGAPPPPYQDLELVERTGQSEPAPAYTADLNQEEQNSPQEVYVPAIEVTAVTEEEEIEPSLVLEVSESHNSVPAAGEEDTTEKCSEC
ncbi:hypothetical protein GCK72_024763 [Caenorhabditis remanei]|uniref:Uncharacterized protein n=1 Tax=Caenorhabditis remanei TaxID=31234 RepID=A0A6A5G042_CAERE|nr:hypothetical protein GCK72_024763 [Caenorhabditis remanei]KAF1748296.1 hypothetical protein GCK72_024763 [Caenorhabditis remanei]